MKRILASLLASAMLVTVSSVSAIAAGGAARPFVLEDNAVIGGTGEFIARGPAVGAGLICDEGTVATGTSVVTGGSRHVVEFTVDKTFTCGDGSGAWTSELMVRLNRKTARTTASWVVTDGTEAYVGLTGAGRLRGVPIVPGESILDIYRGRVAITTP